MEMLVMENLLEDYVAGRLSANDKADFEAEMMMDKELEKEVVRRMFRKMQIEQKIRLHIEKSENERLLLLEKQKFQKLNLKETIMQKWGKLLDSISSN